MPPARRKKGPFRGTIAWRTAAATQAVLGATALLWLTACAGCSADAGETSATGATGGSGAAASLGGGGAGASGGSAGAGAIVEPIADVRANDADGVALRLGETVTIRGIVTVPSDVMSFDNHEIYLQDVTGGISVYEEGLQSFVAELGDDLEVTGMVGQYAGKTELTLPRVVVRGRDAPLPEPIEVTTAGLCAAGEPTESMLVVLRSVGIVGGEPWPTVNQEGNANLVVDDGSGPCALRLDHQTELNGSPEPTGSFDVVGVNKQYDPAVPYDEGYALQPRYRTDVVPQ